MDAKQHLYYALGVLAYAVAKADGKVQREESQIVHKIVKEETQHVMDFDYAGIIFDILQHDKLKFNEVYDWAMQSFELGKHHFSPEMKEQFINVINKVAEAFPPSTVEEQAVIDRFAEDLFALEVNQLID